MDSARVNRALAQPMYLMDVSEQANFVEVAIMGNSGMAYAVHVPFEALQLETLDDSITCTCPDNQRRGKLCKHIFFLLYRVLRHDPTSLPCHADVIRGCREFHLNQDNYSDREQTKRSRKEPRVLDPNQECPICYEKLMGTEMVYCQTQCAQSIHTECYQQCLRYGKSSCPYCRCSSRLEPISID
jgi:hypothetical protein